MMFNPSALLLLAALAAPPAETFSPKAAASIDPLQPLPWLTDSGGFEPDVWAELQAQWAAVVTPLLVDAVGAKPVLVIELEFDGDSHLPYLIFSASAATSATARVGQQVVGHQPLRQVEVKLFYEGKRQAADELYDVFSKASAGGSGGEAAFVNPVGWRHVDFAGERSARMEVSSGPRNPASSGRMAWQDGVVTVRVGTANAAGHHGVEAFATSVDKAFRAAGLYAFPRSRFPEPAAAPIAAATGMFDVNPLFHPVEIRPKGPEMTSFEDVDFLDGDVLARFEAPRIGAIADGVSAILLRFEVPAAGEVCKAEVLGGAANGTAEALLFDETIEVGGLHLAFVLYTPPEVFGAKETERLAGEVAARDVVIHVEIETGDGTFHPFDRTLKLARPPVVLMHGTYDGAEYCWDWKGPSNDFGTSSVTARLRERGFRPFCVDYSGTNGLKMVETGRFRTQYVGSGTTLSSEWVVGGPSHFKDNESVLWNGGMSAAGTPGEGIAAALHFFRDELGLAATRVDVVGHSMGGVLSRVWMRDGDLPQHDQCLAMHGKKRPRLPYRRAGNFNRGDVRRLVTISSTHRGSDISRLLAHYSWDDGSAANEVWSPWPVGVEYVADSQAGTRTGAFSDQVPNSEALNAIGPTPVPSHAIACVAGAAEILRADEAGLLYRGRVENIRWGTPLSFMQRVFQVLGQPADGKRLATHPDPTGVEHMLSFWAGVFGNTENDCVVRLESSFGGLHEVCGKGDGCPHATKLTEVLHGPAPRLKKVQDHLLEVLEGGFTRFEMAGFPAAGGPIERFNLRHDHEDAWQPVVPR